MTLLFFSNLFPTTAEPYRGLDNATLLHSLEPEFKTRVLSPRPLLPWARANFSARPEDAPFEPRWIPAAYLPKIGGAINHRLMARSLRRAFEQTLREFRPRAILSSWIFPDSCAALALAGGRVPVVAIAQGSDVHQYLAMPARRHVILDQLPRAAAVITRSRELSRLLSEAGISPAKLHTIYNGVDLETFQPRDKGAARRELSLPEKARIILFVGNFYDVKNPLLLIEAVARMAAADSVLVMAGAGPLEQPCRELASRLQLGSRVIFAGRTNPAGIARLMNAADILALPSKNEGVPNVILEAFASGLPVVASKVGGIPEILYNDALGRLVEPGSLISLAAAMDDQLARPRETAAIRRHGETFSWSATAANYRTVLRAALSSESQVPKPKS